jgi:hypothetical protein
VFGKDATCTRVAQSVVLPSGALTVHKVAVYLCKAAVPAGAPPVTTYPTDAITLDFCADSAGAPGTVLATASLAASEIAIGFMWSEFTLSVDVAMVVGTTYWLVLKRAGANSATAFFAVFASAELGAAGACRLYNGATWAAPVPDVDVLYCVLGGKPLETQITETIAGAGQFIVGTDCDITTGSSSCEYRPNYTIAQAALESLLKIGCDDDKRLMATVGRDRRVRITKEPVRGASDIAQSALDGVIRSAGSVIRPATCPVGVWVACDDLIPASADVSRMADPGVFFVRRATYVPSSGRWIPDFLGQFADVLETPQEAEYYGDDVPGSWETIRQIVLKRDGYRCAICHKTADETGGPLEIHHLLAREQGGRDGPENLITLCQPDHAKTASYGLRVSAR